MNHFYDDEKYRQYANWFYPEAREPISLSSEALRQSCYQIYGGARSIGKSQLSTRYILSREAVDGYWEKIDQDYPQNKPKPFDPDDYL